jgi:hypothetical protein
VAGEGWRVWDRTRKRWWGNPYPVYPTTLPAELNGEKRPERITALSKGTVRPKKR